MSKTTVRVHLDTGAARPAVLYTEEGGRPYVWTGLNEDVQVCITSLAGAEQLVKLGTEAARMLAEAGAAQESQEPPGIVTSAKDDPTPYISDHWKDVAIRAGVAPKFCMTHDGYYWHCWDRCPECAAEDAKSAPDNSYESYQPNRCHAEGSVGGTYPFSCLATKGHTGDHVAYGPAGEDGAREVCHFWAQEAAEAAAPQPCTHVRAADGQQCPAAAEGQDGDWLYCWLAEGHDGNHWDVPDRVHWRGDGETTRHCMPVPVPAPEFERMRPAPDSGAR